MMRENRYLAEDRAVRENLERASGRASQVNFVDLLNDMVRSDAGRGYGSVPEIREIQKLGYKTGQDHNRTLAKLEAQGVDFNRRHPASRDALQRRSNFEIGNDPGMEPSRFSNDDKFAPDLTEARRVLDSAGKMIAEARILASHEPTGKVEAIRANFLLDSAIRLIQEVRSRSYGQGRV